ncbi:MULTISPECIES: 3-hydroxyanthranilate 3,4-dioxygenase [Streptosporangium]|uniref:3-hydroxyanthranilate 3,4-dioxygenase n=1 Tax=Streptosporangium brasiliense TaxID=47480 RepID=A0ABT9R6F1_9ACTN|nr:3-hydroxyanthranilate 3,4-dioxygenase [Streptosporangium brasiliense]MDP9864442.1 3-hydroxyanthranilate 3,4-dioxygenase [Streptosporangium brasiliense]
MIPPIDFSKWIDEHAHLLKPPVGNKIIFEGAGDLIVMVVGGPNARTDFHVDPYEELFYQVRGNMHINVMTPEGPETVHVREGQMWLLPAGLPHSPQRPEEGSVGFLVERVRPEGVLEKFRWYCLECNAVVHEVELQVRDIVADLPPIFQAFYDDEKARTCDGCGALHPGKG